MSTGNNESSVTRDLFVAVSGDGEIASSWDDAETAEQEVIDQGASGGIDLFTITLVLLRPRSVPVVASIPSTDGVARVVVSVAPTHAPA